MPMEIAQYIEDLRRDGVLLAAAAEAVDLDLPIPSCPEWTMRDLLRHTSMVHRWAEANVRHRRTGSHEGDDSVTYPDDQDLVPWFRQGHAALIETLEQADPAFPFWAFHRASSGLTFWARRQAHETAIHRADAQLARGAVLPFTSEFAADGIDELLLGFASRPRGRLRSDTPRTLGIRAGDAGRDWHVTIGPDPVQVRMARDACDCAVTGRASDLYLLLWNRRGTDGLAVEGDAALLDLWRSSMHVRWS